MIHAIALALAVGIVMGLTGAGGSILTVPILVYVLGLDAVTATAYSLFVVGTTSVVGAISYWRRELVSLRAAVALAVPSLIVVFVTRRFVVPAIPAQVGQIGDLILTRDLLILVLFAVIMAASAISMVLGGRNSVDDVAVVLDDDDADDAEPDAGPGRTAAPAVAPAAVEVNLLHTIVEGLVIGFLTGLVGAGGGFVIVPALVMFSRLPMRVAVGTSLTIIAAKSLVGFLGDVSLNAELDWPLLVGFTGLAIVGILLGSRLARHVPATRLRQGFGWFVLLAAAGILLRELVLTSG